MRILPFIILISLAFVTPAFADTTLTVNATSRVPTYINTGDNVTMLNLSLLSSNSTVSVTSMLINLSTPYSTVTGNLSSLVVNVSIYNDTDSDGIFNATTDTTLFGSNITFGNETNINATNITFSGIIVNTTNPVRLLVVFRINISAATSVNISANITSAASIGTNTTVSGNFPFVSSYGETRDVHANTSVTPHFVDTNVINQTIVYNFTITGSTAVNKTRIRFPSGYSIANISSVTLDSSNQTLDVCPAAGTPAVQACTVLGTTEANITYTPPLSVKWSNVSVAFLVNTSNTRVNANNINSTIYSSDLTMSDISTSAGNIAITTQQLINVTNVAIAKAAAITNGTDYWEFNLTLNFTANLTGIIQFKMSNWTDASNPPNTLQLNTSTVYYATLRNNSNFTDNNGKVNITNVYVNSTGLTQTVTESGPLTLILRMMIPAGTAITNSWAATYSFLFRALT